MFKSMKQWQLLKNEKLHTVVRWLLGIHGVIHFAEMCVNLYEGAMLSACLTALSGSIMIAGALLDLSHHGEGHGHKDCC
jgi:hypothetical protein